MSRRLGTVIVALCVMLAVTGCEGSPPGAAETGVDGYSQPEIGVPDGTGQIGVVQGDSLVDLDGDGTPDAVRLPVAIEVEVPGRYDLVVDVVTEDGAKASIDGEVTLAVGAGVVNLDLPLEKMFIEGMSGSLSLVNGDLFRWDPDPAKGPHKVASAADMGTTGPYDTSSIVSAHSLVSNFTGVVTDTDGDGVADTVTFSGSISVPEAGAYMLTGYFSAPDLTRFKVEDVLVLDVGTNAYSLELSVDPATHGGGQYSIDNVYLHALDSDLPYGQGHYAYVYVDGETPDPDVLVTIGPS